MEKLLKVSGYTPVRMCLSTKAILLAAIHGKTRANMLFNPAINDAQKVKITTSPTARYIKVCFDNSHKGTVNYTMFAEFTVWGQRESK